MDITFDLNKSLYLRDPQETTLGKRIIEHSIILMDELGFEAFNFKKLAKKIGSAEKSEIAIDNIVHATSENPMNKYINENRLHKLIINEGGKAYHIKEIDEENKAGLFYSYKALVKLVDEIIREVNPDFKYSTSLSSNLFEMANNQIYFAEHLPRLTSIKCHKNQDKELVKMLLHYSEKLLA